MEQIINWINNNLTLVAILLSAIAALGAIYPLLKDFIPWLFRFIWDFIRMSFIFAWWILTPIRKPLGIALIWLIDSLIKWLAMRNSKKVKTEASKGD